MAWVGRISGSDKPAIIVFKNVLSNSGLSFSPADNAEGVLPVTFMAHYDAEELDTPPVKMYIPKVQGTISGCVATGAAAQGTLTLDTLPTANDTMTVGATTYTFVADADLDAAGEISLGSGLAECQANIVAAINGTDVYNKPNGSVSIADFSTNAAVITAKVPGVAGNTIVTTETFTAATNVFDAGTLGTTTAGSGDIVAGATVSITIDGEAVTATSGTDGTFSRLKVPLGTYTVSAEKDAQSGSLTNVDVFGGKNTAAGVIIIS